MAIRTSEANIIKPKIFLDDPAVCPECKGTGYILQTMTTPESEAIYGNNTEVEFAIRCPSCNGGHQNIVASAKQRANIPAAFYDSQYQNFDWSLYPEDVSKQKRLIDSFIEDYERWEQHGLGLYIWSKTRGSGKTYLSSCICNTLMQRYAMVTKFVSAANLLNLATNADKNATDAYQRDPISLLGNCKLLVLDDLGAQGSGTQWMSDILFRILDSRMNQRLITLVTSNIRMSELNLDDRLVDRLNKLCQPIPLPDYCVRAKESYDMKLNFFRELGLVDSKKEQVL